MAGGSKLASFVGVVVTWRCWPGRRGFTPSGPPFWGLRWTILYSPGKFQYPGSSIFDFSRVLLEASSIPGPKYPRLPGPFSLPLSSPSSDTKKDLKQITSHLLDMLVSKKVSGQGRDQALNLLNKNVPRKDLSVHDNSRTIYVVDNGEEVGGSGAHASIPRGTRAPCPGQKVEEVFNPNGKARKNHQHVRIHWRAGGGRGQVSELWACPYPENV